MQAHFSADLPDSRSSQDVVVNVDHLTTMGYTRLITEPSALHSFEIELFVFNAAETPTWYLDTYGECNGGSRV